MRTLKFLLQAMHSFILQLTKDDPWQGSEKVYFMKQTVGNACGTIGLLHAVGNLACSSLVDLGMRYPTFVIVKDRRACTHLLRKIVALLNVIGIGTQMRKLAVYLECRGRLLSAALCQANCYDVS
jgi:hypothetical protein